MAERKRFSLIAGALFALAIAAPAAANEVAVMNSESVLNNSAVGQHIRTRLEEIAAEMESEISDQGTPLQERWQEFQAETSSLTAEALQESPEIMERGRELQGEIFQLNVTEQVLARELVATRVQAMQPVREALDEVLNAIVEEREIDVLVEREVLIFAGDAADITELVIERLDEALSEVEVERVRIPVEEVEEATEE